MDTDTQTHKKISKHYLPVYTDGKNWTHWEFHGKINSDYFLSIFLGDKENTEAFVKHMNSQLNQYGKVAVVNLVDQTGKEKVLQDAFLKHTAQYNQKQVSYISFDFHEYWWVLTIKLRFQGEESRI